MVSTAGLEPARVSPHAPQTCTYTDSVTSTKINIKFSTTQLYHKNKNFSKLIAKNFFTCFKLYMEIKNYNSNIQFQAKYLKSDSLTDIVNYAVEHGNFDKLNEARKNVDKTYIRTRLKVDLCNENNLPVVIISRYVPKSRKAVFSLDEYTLAAQTKFIAPQKMNPLHFGLQTLIKLGDNAPNNDMYKKVVSEKGKIIAPYLA